MTREMIERMDGLTSFEAMKQLQMAVACMTRALIAEGLPQEDVAGYIQQNVTWVIGDVIDDMA